MQVNNQFYLSQPLSTMSQSGNTWNADSIAVNDNIESKKDSFWNKFLKPEYAFKWGRQSCPTNYKRSESHQTLDPPLPEGRSAV